MAEHPERQRRRFRLQKERSKITQAQEWLNSATSDEQYTGAYDFGSRVKAEPANDWVGRHAFA